MPRLDRDPPRHSLVRVHARAWQAWLAAQSALQGEPVLRDWAARGWPLIARRALPGEAAGVPLGLPLPPALGKRRIAVTLPADAIESVFSLPSLRDAMAGAPLSWQATLHHLVGVAEDFQVEVRVFGSLAWQALTGLAYLGANSDLDLLWTLPARARLADLLATLAMIEAHAPMRLDGEFVRADGAGVNWRELHAGAGEALVKTCGAARLEPVATFLGEAA